VRTLVTSAVLGTAGSARTGVGVAELVLRRGPALAVLGARATIGIGTDAAAAADASFRDDLLMLFDDAGEIAWRQARRVRLELGARTSPPEGRRATDKSAPRPADAGRDAPPRRHRVKA
jgi:hypothetical protein